MVTGLMKINGLYQLPTLSLQKASTELVILNKFANGANPKLFKVNYHRV